MLPTGQQIKEDRDHDGHHGNLNPCLYRSDAIVSRHHGVDGEDLAQYPIVQEISPQQQTEPPRASKDQYPEARKEDAEFLKDELAGIEKRIKDLKREETKD